MSVILYTKDFDASVTEPVDVILSPQFYWIKKIEAPIKSRYEAKKAAKNLFDLDEREYIFDAFKINDTYFAVAIAKNLDLAIDKKYIRSIRLAQTELYEYDCINVSKNHSIQKIEDILFCFPKASDCPDIKRILPTIKLSKHKIDLFNKISIDTTSLVLGFAALLLIGASFFIQGFAYKKELSSIQKQKTALAQRYNLPSSTYALDAILQKYEKIESEQKRLRKDLEFFSDTPARKFLQLGFDAKQYEVAIQSQKSLDDYFKKRFTILSSQFKNGIYKAKLVHK